MAMAATTVGGRTRPELRALGVRAGRVALLAVLITVVEVVFSFPLVSSMAGRAFAASCGAVRAADAGLPERVLVFVDENRACLSGDSEGVTAGRVVVVAGLEGPLLRHEMAHVEQVERLGSLGFALSYGAMKVWASAHGGHPYLDHPFELEAIRREVPTQEADAP